jgi:hypothetical protein
LLSGGEKVSEARGWPDLTLKLYLIDITSFMLREAWAIQQVDRPAMGTGDRRVTLNAELAMDL